MRTVPFTTRLILFLLLLLGWAPGARAQAIFAAEQIISNTADAAQYVATADVDRDGDLDVLSASFDDDTVAWSENLGAGAFGPRQPITTTADGASAVVPADIDRDGDLDVVVASAFAGTVAWYENTDGAGSFGAEQLISNLAAFTQSVFAADVDGDGDLDVLSASLGDDKIAWYENTDGLGTFGPQQLVTVAADAARFVSAADLDGDGDVDVLSASLLDDTIAWYENTDGSGGFGPARDISTTADGPQSLATADLDRDGDLDVVAASGNDDTIAWYENLDGLGSFSSRRLVSDAADGALSVALADADGDGDVDIFAASQLDDTVAWYPNLDGVGSFGSAQVLGTAAFGAFSVAAADLDGDGDTDALAASFLDDTVAWYRNETIHRSGAIGRAEELTTFVGEAVDVFAVVAADVDGDGDLDAVSARTGSFRELVWYENEDGRGLFGRKQLIDPSGPDFAIVPADLDGDGDVDLLSAGLGGIAWYENTDGAGGFAAPQELPTSESEATATFAADFDGDGDLDVVSGLIGNQPVTWSENLDGRGNFGPQQDVPAPFLPDFLTAADLDGDGDLDILNATRVDETIAWHANTDGQGSFGPRIVVWAGAEIAESLAAADLDGDGDLDVVSAERSGDRIAWYPNTDGAGSFGVREIISSTAAGARSVFAADVDRDGDIDVLSASEDDDTVAWYENLDGLGSFGAPRIIDADASTDGAASVFAADLDGDGDVDVLSASALSGSVAWYENADGRGGFDTAERAPPGPTDLTAFGTAAGDFDGDGDPDVVFGALFGSGELVLHENTDGDGSLGPAQVIEAQVNPGATEAVDVDGDGDLDLLTGSGTRGELRWFENLDGLGSFGPSQLVDSGPFSGVLRPIAGADLDRDGAVDFIASDRAGGRLVWYENDGLGGFGPEQLVAGAFAEATDLAAADLDRDGDLDVLAASFSEGLFAWWENLDGQGSFGPRRLIGDGAENASSIQAVDLDGDGDLDVAGAQSSPANKVVWYEHLDGNGAFGPAQLVADVEQAQAARAIDIDRDGDLDLLAASLGGDAVLWFENTDGAGSFGPGHVISQKLLQAARLIATDFDGDGDADVLTTPLLDLPTWQRNRSGQVEIVTTSALDAAPLGGKTMELLRFELRHLGRSGDASAELTSVALLFDRIPSTPITSEPAGPLSGAEADALFDALRLHRDDGSGLFEPGLDPLVAAVDTASLVAGIGTAALADGDPHAQVAAATHGLFFLVADLAIDAGSADPNAFRVRHLASAARIEHAGSSLRLEQAPGGGTEPGLIRVPEPGGPLPFVAGAMLLAALKERRSEAHAEARGGHDGAAVEELRGVRGGPPHRGPGRLRPRPRRA